MVCNHIIWQGCYVGDQYKIHIFFLHRICMRTGFKVPSREKCLLLLLLTTKMFTMMSSHVNQLIWLLLSGADH